MSILINAPDNTRKGRLAGFFLSHQFSLLLFICYALLAITGCEQHEPMIPGELAFQQAKQAQAQGLGTKAAELYQQSASLGFLPAIDARLALQQPTDSSAELRAWLVSLPEAMQPSLLRYYQQLGSKLSLSDVAPAKPTAQFSADCRITIQPVVSAELEHKRWQVLVQTWQQDSFLSTLPVCMLPVQRIDADLIKCSDNPDSRLTCDLSALQPLVKAGAFNQLLILSGRGSANFNNGVLQLPTYADIQLLKHEFSHVLGFIDEYALNREVAGSECLPGRITPNILFSKADLPQYLQHWQLANDSVQLTEVETCQRAGLQAFRVVAETSHLQHYELAIPALYQILMHKQLALAQDIMPVQYYFAYLARQAGDWTLWQAQMERAAVFGYPAAQAALAEWHSRQAASSTAR